MKKTTLFLAALCANAMANHCLTGACGINEMATSHCVDPNNQRTVAVNDCAKPMCSRTALYNEDGTTMYQKINTNGCVEKGIAWADHCDKTKFADQDLQFAHCVASCAPC